MSFQPQFEQISLRERLEPFKVQSVVECKANDNYESFVKILSTKASVTCLGGEALSGEVRYSGRVIFNIVYLDVEGKLKKSECGAEFSHKAEKPEIQPTHMLDIEMCIDSVEIKQVGGLLSLTAIVTSTVSAAGNSAVGYLLGGEGLVVRKEEISIPKSMGTAKGSFEVAEEFDINEAIKDILSYNAEAIVMSTQTGIGCVVSEGEIYLSLITERAADGDLLSQCKIFPFRMELELEESMPNMKGITSCNIMNVKFEVLVDPDRNKSTINTEFNLEIKAEVFDSVPIEKVSDVYSTVNELNITTQSLISENLTGSYIFSEKIHGAAIMSQPFENDIRILFAADEKVNIAATMTGEGRITAEGVMSATAYYRDYEDNLGSVVLELPFSVELVKDGFKEGAPIKLSCIAQNLYARMKAGREIELEGTLKIVILNFETDVKSVITELTLGDEKLPNTSAMSIYIPDEEDTLWDVSKELGVCPELIMEFNKDLTFPLKGDERILVYRQEKIDY